MAISKRTRYEVLKRDSFKCQYCGRQAPDVLLEVDHINPKSKGGSNDLLNLVTSCVDCNRGKSNIELSDDSSIKKQKSQLDILQKKREQLAAMFAWKKELLKMEELTIRELSNYWHSLVKYHLTDLGMDMMKPIISTYGLDEVMESMKIAANQYYKPDSDDVRSTVEHAIKMVSMIAKSRRINKDKPYMSELYYIRGIAKKRLSCLIDYEFIQIAERAYLSGVPIGVIKDLTCICRYYKEWREAMVEMIGQPQA